MKRLVFVLLAAVCAMATNAYAGPDEGTYFSSGNTNTTPLKNAYGLVVRPINGSPAQSLTIASAVTTNTTTTPVAGVSGNKTFWAEVMGTGAVTATVAIYGNRTNTNSNGVLLATITLSGTTTATDAAAVSTAAYPYYYVTTTNVTGTGATVGAYAFY